MPLDVLTQEAGKQLNPGKALQPPRGVIGTSLPRGALLRRTNVSVE
jgi:hypothetical protein